MKQKKVLMLRDEVVFQPAGGPLRVLATNVYDLDEVTADSLVGRGYAKLVDEDQKQSADPIPYEFGDESGSGETLLLEGMKIGELRKMAVERGAKGVSSWSKDELIAFLIERIRSEDVIPPDPASVTDLPKPSEE